MVLVEGDEPEKWEGEEPARLSCRLVRNEDEMLFSFSVASEGRPGEAESVSAAWSQPESSKMMSKEEEVQSLGRRGKLGPTPQLSRSDTRLSTLKPTAPLSTSAPQEGSETSRLPPVDGSELETGTLTDSTSMLSRRLSGQSVALKDDSKERVSCTVG